jgi:hypothetical protein
VTQIMCAFLVAHMSIGVYGGFLGAIAAPQSHSLIRLNGRIRYCLLQP